MEFAIPNAISKTSICLNMIVKNESHVIVETLENLCSYINFSYWVISDTGSTDNTKEVITSFFLAKNIPGEIVEHEWRDFGYNRSKALECAYNKTDYLLIFDADDRLIGDFKLPVVYDKDQYQLLFGTNFVYTRPLLINNRKKWCFKGVLHESLSNMEEVNGLAIIEGNYHVMSGRTGARSQNPNKYIDDANILKKAHFDELKTDYNLSCRYAFYCAQSYKDAGVNYYDDAIEWYKKCLDLKMWVQEKFYGCLNIGLIYSYKKDYLNALKYWYKTIEYDPERIEGIIHAMNYLRNDGQHIIINALYHKFKNYNKNLEGKLFLFKNVYNDELEYHNTISAFYINDKKSGYECCKTIILNNTISYSLLKSTISNMQFYIDFLKNDLTSDIANSNAIKMFYVVDKIMSDICCKNEPVDANIMNIWNILFEKCRPLLTTYDNNYSFVNRENPQIIISFTTCKRLELFKQTIHSILNHWLDVDKIDYWFCVDDNSCQEDRNDMKTLYPWIDYYMKNTEEKGHKRSMNIIWDKLNELKPTYWIHMEDDFLFHTKMNYVEEAIRGLSSSACVDAQVKQILFNKDYGETIEQYNSMGHVMNNVVSDDNNSIIIHEFKEGVFPYQNCHYWPHYSFRPSLTDVKTILELGNFDTEDTFFEMTYAKKWTTTGYKTGFFNKITNRHIGRLTINRGDKTSPNAYELNSEAQFFKPPATAAAAPEPSIKIINLERRADRKATTIQKLSDVGINEDQYEFIKAVDGFALEPTIELKRLFDGNDFQSRKGFIGCALSHYDLWKRLLADDKNEYYVIMEDDFSPCSHFKQKFMSLLPVFKEKEMLFMGYHMFEKNRSQVSDIYVDDPSSEIIKVLPLNKKLYIGGTFMYSINKKGAQICVDYIQRYGIKHGIDYLMKIMPNLSSFETQHHMAFSIWNEHGVPIDSDIQNIGDCFDFSKLSDVVEDFSGKSFIKSQNNKIIGFYGNELCERGTSIALYDYAHFNETILNNKSIIFYEKNNSNNNADVIEKFNARFNNVYALNEFSNIEEIVEKESIDILYFIKYGKNDNKLSKKCKNVVHCVFDCSEPHGNVYASIAPWVKYNNGKYPYVPHIINLPLHKENMRDKLNIPIDAIVLGRHGGYYQFDISFVQEAIFEYASSNPNTYFLFVNTKPFCRELSNIIHLDKIIDLYDKVFFINTCDAMIHGRSDGEVFPLSIGEFSTCNKPIITTKSVIDNGHLELLGDKAIIYNNKEELLNIFSDFKQHISIRTDWNAYADYTPEKVMKIFDSVFINNKENVAIQSTGQRSENELHNKYIFIPDVDQCGFDIYYHKKSLHTCFEIAEKDESCVAFNTLGFFKNVVDLQKICASPYFKKGDGIYIKKEYYDLQILEKNKHNKKPHNVFLYWIGKEYKLLNILRNMIYLHSTNGIGYNVILITPDNISEYIDIPDYFYELLPAHQADLVRVYVICKYGGIWLDSDTIVMESLDSLFDIIQKKNGFFILENNNYLCNGIFGSKPNTELMNNWKSHIKSTLDSKKSNISWSELGNIYLHNKYKTTTLFNNYELFNGLDNLYPVGPHAVEKEFILNPYDNFKNIIRTYQPLVVLVNAAYKAVEHLTEFEILNGNMPINYFINKSFSNMKHLKDINFIEIGTSNFDTLIQNANDETSGLCVEPLSHYLYSLPCKKNVIKINKAITDNTTKNDEKMDIYYIPEDVIEKQHLPEWLKGCNSINSMHPLHIKHNLQQYVKIENIGVISIKELLYGNSIRNAAFIKIDTEGHDCTILNGLYNYIKFLPDIFHPLTIKFETNENTKEIDVNNILNLYEKIGYELKSRDYDTIITKKINNHSNIWNELNSLQSEMLISDEIPKTLVEENADEAMRVEGIRIKMLCNWTNSENLCKEWSNMCDDPVNFRWKNYQIVWSDDKGEIDYYVIINSPPRGAYFDPFKTIVFQMEPWVNDSTKNWGVKTWGQWAEPDPSKFLAVRGRKTDHPNLVQNETELHLNELYQTKNFEKTRDNVISSLMSSKYYDEGHIIRVNLLRFLEEKNTLLFDIYGEQNTHNFKNYRGQISKSNKSKGYVSYKYYFMMENNFENNYITEKIWDPILCECLCFYYGCPNVTDYIDARAFVLLDPNDFEKSYQIIKQAIEEDWWSQRIDVIRQEKRKILSELSFFPTIDKILTRCEP